MNKPKLTLITLILSAFLCSYADAAEKEKSGMKRDDMDKMNMTPMADMLKGKSGDEFEAAYLGMMIMHHKEGVKMANMALEKAGSSQLKQMVEKMKSEQEADIDKMTGWLKEWHSKSPNDFSMPPESEQMMQKSMSELKGLSGAEFDKMFAKHMAHHHMDAIAMSKMAESKAKHGEVKKLASKTVSSQTEERKKLMKMAKS
jgi:uncharacterized protein (DUF305 family)